MGDINGIDLHNYRVVSMAIVSHKNCGLNFSPMNQLEHSSHVKKLANNIDV